MNPIRSLDRALREQSSLLLAPLAHDRPQQETLATLDFTYTKKELDSYLVWRTAGLARKSSVRIIKAAEVFWMNTKGMISKGSLDDLRSFLFKK